jgi:hypothetical protein
MNDSAVAVKEALQDSGVVSFYIAIGQWPATPDEAVLINNTGGRNPYPHLALNFPSVQIMARGKPSGYLDASAQIQKVCEHLLGMSPRTLNGDMYRSCNQMGDVIYLGQDDRSRPMLSANFWFIVEPSSLGNRTAIS